MKLVRTLDPAKTARMRRAVGRIHALSFVNGSSDTLSKWNVVNHSWSGRS